MFYFCIQLIRFSFNAQLHSHTCMSLVWQLVSVKITEGLLYSVLSWHSCHMTFFLIIYRNWANMVSSVWRTLFMKSSLWGHTSRRPTTSCGRSSWAMLVVAIGRRPGTSLKEETTGTGNTWSTNSFGGWTKSGHLHINIEIMICHQ